MAGWCWGGCSSNAPATLTRQSYTIIIIAAAGWLCAAACGGSKQPPPCVGGGCCFLLLHHYYCCAFALPSCLLRPLDGLGGERLGC